MTGGLPSWLAERTVGELVAAGVVVVVVAGWLRRKFWPGLRDLVLGLVDLVGAPARGNRPARPGLLATVDDLVRRVHEVQSEQGRQGDRMTRVEGVAAEAASASVANQAQLLHVVEQVTALDAKVDDVAAEQTRIRNAVEAAQAAAAQNEPAEGAHTHDGPAET